MRYLVLSDLHANLPALDAVLADARQVGYDAVLVLGDLVGYGAEPGAVLARTLDLAPAAIVRGNHDRVCAGLESSSSFNDVARASIEWTAGQLSAAELAALAGLAQGPRRVNDVVEIAHGAPFDEDYYVFDAADAERAMAGASASLCLVGHTHVAAVFTIEAIASDGPPEARIVPISRPMLVNVGSVGQPRDGDPRAAYGVVDLAAEAIELRRVPYDIARAQRAILDAGLPPWLAARLERGQ